LNRPALRHCGGRVIPHVLPESRLRAFSCVVAALLLVTLCGCKTQSGLTAQALRCDSGDVEVVKSRYAQSGVTTAWCAKCKGKLYQCVSNPDRSRVECKEATPNDPCG
jgi:hypothetical protein